MSLEHTLNANLFMRRNAMESDSDSDSWDDDDGGTKQKKPKAKKQPINVNAASLFGGGAAHPQASKQSEKPVVKTTESFASRAAALQARLMGIKPAGEEEEEPAPAPAPPAPEPEAQPFSASSWGSPAPSAAASSSDLGDWVEAQDPSSGMTYYYNSATGETSWSKPEPPKPAPVKSSAPPPIPSASSSSSSFGSSASASVSSSASPAGRGASASTSFAARANALSNLFGGGASSSSSSSAPRTSSAAPPPLPAAAAPPKEKKWQTQVDPSSGATYYYHIETGETSWTNPEQDEVAPPPPEPVAPAAVPSFSSSSFGSSMPPPMPPADEPPPPPPPSDWEAVTDPSSGSVYYYNRATGATQWEMPAELASPSGSDWGSSPTHRIGGSVVIDERSLIQGFSQMSSDFTHDRTMSISQPGPRTMSMDANSASTTRKHVRKLSADYVSPRSTLANKINQYSMLEYGRQFFQKHSRGLLRSGDVSVDELLSHTKSKLDSSLHKPPNSAFVEDSLQVFKNITGFMQDRPSGKDPHGHVIKLAVRGLQCGPELRDEIFCLCVKQTTNNRNIESLERGWQLIALLCGLFAPSDRLLNYFYCFLLRGSQNNASKRVCQYATLAMDNLDDTLRFGPRIQPPTLVEVSSVETLRPVVVNIETLDPQVTWPITCTAQTRVKDVYRTIAQQLKIPFESDYLTNFSLFQTMLNKGRVISALALQDGSRILDVISFWNSALQEALKKNSAASIGFKFVFKVDFYLRSAVFGAPEIITHLYFMQGATDIIRGVYSPTEKESLWLAALILQARYGDAPANIILEDVLPAPIVANIKEKNIPATVNEIEKLRAQFRGTSKAAAKDQFLGYVHQWKNFGLTAFLIREVRPKSHKIEELGINENGLFKIDPKTRMWWLLTPLDGVLMYEAIDGAFKWMMGSANAKPEEVLVVVDYPEELKKLMHKYKLSTRMSSAGDSGKNRTLIPIQKK